MIDHFNLPVSNLEASITFYETVMAALDVPLLVRETDAVGFGKSTWQFGLVKEVQGFVSLHVAFVANSHETVDQFHRIALTAGGKDNGRPGLRLQYGLSYYAAYVIDPDGHNVEVVCRKGGGGAG